MKTLVVLRAFIPTTSLARVADFSNDLAKIGVDHKAQHVTFEYVGPYADAYVPENLRGAKTNERQPEPEAAERTERGQAAADDFADESEPAADKPAGRKPRSDAGKPRGPRGGGKEADGSAAEGPERPAARAKAGGAAGGDGARSPARGGGEGQQAGGGRQRTGEGSSGRTRRADDGNGKAAEVAADEEDWGSGGDEEADAGDLTNQPAAEDPEFETAEEAEEWWAKTPDKDGWPDSLMPDGELNRAAMNRILSDHFRANGGKNKQPTFAIVADVADGAGNLDEVHADYFDPLARALLRDTAKLRYGVKRPGK